MNYSNLALNILEIGAFPLVVFCAILFTVLLGWVIGNTSHHKSNKTRTATDDTLIGAILGLMGLLVAFTFSGAANRLDQRERLIITEANAVSNAFIAFEQIDLKDRSQVDALYRKYLDQRITLYTNVFDQQAFKEQESQIELTLKDIRQQAKAISMHASPQDKNFADQYAKATMEMASTYLMQRQAMLFHPPRIIWISLMLLITVGSFLAGFKMGLSQRREFFISMMFAALMSCAIYLIICLEFPLLGKVSLESYTNEFVKLRNQIPFN